MPVEISCIIVTNQSAPEACTTVVSLENQSVEPEIICVDNQGNRNFSSAASALNHGAIKAAGRYLFFLHQDVEFPNKDFLKDCVRELDNLPDLGVAGLAGVRRNPTSRKIENLNEISHGAPPRMWGTKILEPTRVQTLDEFCLIVPRDVFARTGFDEVVCDHWHLYGVELCLTCLREGLSVYALPFDVYHESDGASGRSSGSIGAMTPDYARGFERVRRKHKDAFPEIVTTCASYETRSPVLVQRASRFLKRTTGVFSKPSSAG